jgi:hypothetical protein
VQHARREDIHARAEDDCQLGAQEAKALTHGDTALEQKGSYLVDDTGALPDKAFADAMQRLQIELVSRIYGEELHRRALHGLGDRFGVVEVVLLSLGRT